MILIEKEIPKFNTPKELNDYLNDFDYGISYDGENIYDPSQDDFVDKYSAENPDEFADSEIGVCWDFVSAEKEYFDKNFDDIDWVKTFYVEWTDRSHTFLVYKQNNMYYYFESSWYDYQGIYEFDELAELFEQVIYQMQESFGDSPYQIFMYDVNDSIYGLSTYEFMDYVYNTGKVILSNL